MGINIGVVICVSQMGLLIGFDCKGLPDNWIVRLRGSSEGF